MGRSIIKKLRHQWMSFERLLDDAALNAHAPAMDEPHLSQTRGVCFIQILFDDGRDVARREGMKIEDSFDGDSQRPALGIVEGVLILHRQPVAGFS
jgi:hypothetical protein